MRITEKWFLGIGILLISLLITAGLACKGGGEGGDGGDGDDTGAVASATTSDASSVTLTSATLNGEVNPNGLSTTTHFEYGTTDSYGSSTATTNAGSGTTAIVVTEDLSDLIQGTTYHFRLVASNSQGTSNGADKTFTTLNQISIFNESPTYKSSFTSDSSPVTISGRGSGSIDAITWKNNTNGLSGNATGTSEWSVEISLEEGDNELEITASYPGWSEQTVTITLTATYNPYVSFTSLPQMTPSTGIAGNTYDPVYVRVGIDPTSLDSSSVKVFQVDEAGNKVGTALGSLTDDGNLSNGDEIQGDGIYSANISVYSADAVAFTLRIFANDANGIEQKTGVFSLNFFPQPTAEQITTQSANNDATFAKFNELFSTAIKTGVLNKDEMMIQSFDEMVDYLKGLDGIVDAGKGGFGVWWLNDAGMFGVMSLTDFEDEQKLGEEVWKESVTQNDLRQRGERPVSKSCDPISTRVEYLKTAFPKTIMLEDEDEKYNIGSHNAIHISPYKGVTDWYAAHAAGTGWFNVVKNAKCPAFNKVEKINNVSDPQDPLTAKVLLDVWKTLSNYGLISSLTHGDSFDIVKKALEEKYPALKLVDWLFPWHDKRVVFHANILIDFTADGLLDYLSDILAGRLMIFPWGDGKVKLVITPEFIAHYNGTFPNSIWYSMSCRSAFNDTMAAVFLAKGGGAFYGFTDYVLASYAFNTERTSFEKIINEEKNAGEAFDAAVAAHGANDGGTAAIVFYGEKKTKIAKEKVKNPSFEDPDGAGSLNGWITSGDGRAIKVLGADLPTDGGTMALISTGLGFTTQTGSIYQSFCLPENAKNLIFDWNFYSEEFKEWCGSQYDDTFQVSIIDIDTGVETVVFLTSVNILCGNLGALIKSPVEFDQGDTWYTGWQLDQTADISALKGKGIILKFFATDLGDSIYDTAILIDNIRITIE